MKESSYCFHFSDVLCSHVFIFIIAISFILEYSIKTASLYYTMHEIDLLRMHSLVYSYSLVGMIQIFNHHLLPLVVSSLKRLHRFFFEGKSLHGSFSVKISLILKWRQHFSFLVCTILDNLCGISFFHIILYRKESNITGSIPVLISFFFQWHSTVST